jgi:hypothetical protein
MTAMSRWAGAIRAQRSAQVHSSTVTTGEQDKNNVYR